MKKTVIIIGGGISGLTSGIYAKLNGYDAVILEKNHLRKILFSMVKNSKHPPLRAGTGKGEHFHHYYSTQFWKS